MARKRIPPTHPLWPSKTFAEVQREHIERVLDQTKGVVSDAAARLYLPRTTLYHLMRRLGISRSDWASAVQPLLARTTPKPKTWEQRLFAQRNLRSIARPVNVFPIDKHRSYHDGVVPNLQEHRQRFQESLIEFLNTELDLGFTVCRTGQLEVADSDSNITDSERMAEIHELAIVLEDLLSRLNPAK